MYTKLYQIIRARTPGYVRKTLIWSYPISVAHWIVIIVSLVTVSREFEPPHSRRFFP